jgi:hypothetical protein
MSIKDLIAAAFNKDASAFESAFSSAMKEKVGAAIDSRFLTREELELDEAKDEDENGDTSSEEDNDDEDEEDMKEEVEEVEELDELSKKTLASYTQKAADSMANAAHSLGKKSERADEVDRMTNRHMPDKYTVRDNMKKALDADEKSQRKDREVIGKRIVGISKATDRMSK